ncbi:MAG: hypothetical protein RLZZ01_2211, partial [Actinomycetota bacterium]
TKQGDEFRIRHEVLTAAEILRSMWVVNPSLCRAEGRIGVLAPGATGDVVVSTVDPLEDLDAFADTTTSLTHVVQAGRVVVDRA